MTRSISRATIVGGLVAVLALTALVYSSSFSNRFLNWDDPVNVTQNRAIRDLSVGNVRVWFTQPLLGMYSPLVYASYAADYRIGGLNPDIYHATNLGLHLICVALVFGIVAALSARPVAAVLAAAVFAVHPANVAAVTPISVRSSLLYSAFYLAAYRAYLWHLESPKTQRIVTAFVLFAAASLSKSAAAVFPLLMLLTDWYRHRHINRAVLLEKLPFLAVAIAVGGVTLALRADVATGDPLQTSWIERGALAAFQLTRYAATAVAPLDLSPFYPYPERRNGSLPAVIFIAPILVAAAAALIARAGRLRPVLVFGVAFFVLHLTLVLKVVPLGEEFTADRYLYIPLVGLCVMAVQLTGSLSASARQIGVGLIAVVIAVCSIQAYRRNADWRDDMTFNSRILEHYPHTATAYSNRAAARLQTGDVDGARRDSNEAIRIDGANARAYFNRATAGMLSGRPVEALADINRSIELDPALSASFELRAQARLNAGDLTGARDDADRAIALAPNGDEVFKSYVTRGLARAMLNDGRGALADLDRAVALNPTEPAILQNRGQVRITFGDKAGGCADLREAVARGREETRPLVAQLCGGEP